MWNDPNTDSEQGNGADNPPAPSATSAASPTRSSFSAIGAPKVEPQTPAVGVVRHRPAAEVNPPGPPRPAASSMPNSVIAPPPTTPVAAAPLTGTTPTPPERPALGSALAFDTRTPVATVAPVAAPEPKKRRTGVLVLLALLTVLASGAVSYFVATNIAGDSTASTPVPLPTAASAPADVEPAPESAATTPAVDAAVLGEEPFAVAAEIIRPSVVQLNLGQGLGTGVIINENGTILTAAHVLGTETDVTVTFFDGSSAQGTVVGTDVTTDVGVVQIDPEGRDLVVARLADGEDVRVGQIAIAVGSPFGFDQTVTAGIVSAVDRIVNNVSMVQTDASINPGNSGGPLINLDGEVIGINDLIFTESGSSAGVGFAISIDLAVIIADQIVQGIEPQLALFGVSTTVAPDGARGAQVAEVVTSSAAEAAGIELGDVIITFDGVDVRGSSDLRAQVIDEAPGTPVTITVLRDGEPVDLSVTLGSTG